MTSRGRERGLGAILGGSRGGEGGGEERGKEREEEVDVCSIWWGSFEDDQSTSGILRQRRVRLWRRRCRKEVGS